MGRKMVVRRRPQFGHSSLWPLAFLWLWGQSGPILGQRGLNDVSGSNHKSSRPKGEFLAGTFIQEVMVSLSLFFKFKKKIVKFSRNFVKFCPFCRNVVKFKQKNVKFGQNFDIFWQNPVSG